MDYTLRAPSVGSQVWGRHLTPVSNEWDMILLKSDNYIKNQNNIYSAGQDIWASSEYSSVYRWYDGNKNAWQFVQKVNDSASTEHGFRPVLELPTDLAADSLKVVELITAGYMPGETSDSINIIVKKGESFTAPSAEGLPLSDSISADTPMWWVDENRNFYKPGDTVPADVSELLLVCDYDVTFLPGAYGAGEPMTESKRHNVSLTLPSALFTRTGHTQVGWATTDGGEKVYGFDDVYTQNEALTLYPVWNTNQYTITFDTAGGSEIAPITQDYGTNIIAPCRP